MTLTSPAQSTSELASRVQAVIRAKSESTPRNAQRAIGPSQIGEACDRQVAYQLLDMPRSRTGIDPWASIVGTATHAWLAEAFTEENRRLGQLRYLVECPVRLTDGIKGTCDLFDLWGSEVIDHKILGTESMRKIGTGEVPTKYRVQLHLYGYGFTLVGMPVRTVSIVAYPRSGFLDGIKTWTEPYDEALATSAMDRLGNLTTAVYMLKLDEHNLWGLIRPTPSRDCNWCPWWRPTLPVDGCGCPGQET